MLESGIKSDDFALGQRSSQMLTLFYFLLLLIADKLVLLDSEKLHVVFQLMHLHSSVRSITSKEVTFTLHYLVPRKIADTVSSPTVALSELPNPSFLIEEHHSLFHLCYPDKKLS